MDLKNFYTRQISFTEWFESVNHPNTVAIRLEDNEKRERLKVLNEVIGLPFDKPVQFEASDIADNTPKLQEFLVTHPTELWALRLIPKDPSLPKLRVRGFAAVELIRWFHEQKIDATKYRADFVPHPGDDLWATIFVVNGQGMYGEIIRGGHQQLTQGFYENGTPITFAYHFATETWEFSEVNPDAATECGRALAALRVSDAEQRELLKQKLEAQFAGEYLCGYFESVTTGSYGLWFIDYNRVLGKLYEDFSMSPQNVDNPELRTLRGQIGNPGQARGRAEVVLAEALSGATLEEGEILVCNMTTPEYIHLMKSAGAIVTDLGGILSHAAIVARELRKPCIVGTGNATTTIHNHDMLDVDANQGVVTILGQAGE